ncbi:cystatin C (amyloid angiopathy and cerebral hemorrhage) precursor [Esox lucius]|nr:cystatin C (amyloid angiopathy and cerebral hemorrhage) precursor [Esox lucius]ACO14463.1 Cystatin precursor [Esox lucius]
MIMDWKIVVPLLAVILTVASEKMVGAPSDADMNDQGLKNALQFAVVEHNKRTNDMYIRQVASVVKAQKQVVAGIKYIFTVNMGRTPCKKSGAETNCSVHEDPGMAATYRCTFEVWSRPWMSDIQLLKNDCPQ